MEKIITLTLNPAIDKTTYTAKILPERKLRCTHPTYEPGGGGINVSRALAHLGVSNEAMYLAGGYTGSFFQQLIAQENINSIVIPIKGNTRTNIVVVEESTHLQYRFGMESPPVFEEEWKECLEELEKLNGYEYIVASGSLPAGVPLDFFGRVAAIVKKRKAKLVIDTSGEALQHAVTEGVFMIKPNLNELSSLYGVDELKRDNVVEAARSVIAKGGCEALVVSMGPEAALLITQNENIRVVPPNVEVKSTVGAGDSMVAGILYALSKKWSWSDVLKYGVACGTSATMNDATGLCKKDQVEQIFNQLRKQ